jgi:glycosyltransferase involved in cell wall biosynthesis
VICLLHGYLLEGSGSNLWTRSVVESLCRQGHTIHLMAQENHPERYPFIAEWRQYHADGSMERTRLDDPPYPGRCILHRPILGDLLPVYVWDRYEEFPRVVPMIDLTDEEVEDYLHRNVRALFSIVRDNGITTIHVNHSVLMSVVAQRVSESTGVPFAVMPHGSALEFAVKRDVRFRRQAESSFAAARRVLVQGDEMRQRVLETLPGVPGLEDKIGEIHLGVDTRQFEPLPRSGRRERITDLTAALAGVPRGRTSAQTRRLREGVREGIDEPTLRGLFASIQDYDGKRPDADLEEKLEAVDWEHDRILLFVGRLISTKGVHGVVAALPFLLERVPELRLLVVGHGPLREPLEAMIAGLTSGDRELVMRIVRRGGLMEGSLEGDRGAEELTQAARYLDGLEAEGRLDDWFEAGRRWMGPERVIFTGYLTHRELHHLFPCCDAAVFPSVVREAGPLVFLEAIASGVFPLGTYFGGMRASIDAVAGALPPGAAEAMKLDPLPGGTVADIETKVPEALTLAERHREALHRIAAGRFDWTSVTAKLLAELEAL